MKLAVPNVLALYGDGAPSRPYTAVVRGQQLLVRACPDGLTLDRVVDGAERNVRLEFPCLGVVLAWTR